MGLHSLREYICNSTDYSVITVAHRLSTITDYDKVIVMDEGEVIEIGDTLIYKNKIRSDRTPWIFILSRISSIVIIFPVC